MKKLKKVEKNTKKEEKRFKPDIRLGLNDSQVAVHKENNETNKRPDVTDKSYLRIIFEHTVTFFNILMISIALLFILVVGPSAIGNISFILIVIANILIGTIQECRAKHMVSRLKMLNTAKNTVIRNGKHVKLYPDDLVLDDVIILETGDQVPADSIILSGIVESNESLLTGESDPVHKRIGDVLFSGSFIISGRCIAQVNKVGTDSYIYSIESKARGFKRPHSKLMKSISGIIKKLTCIVVPLGLLTFWNSFIKSGNFPDAVTRAGTSMVGMIPGGMMLLASIAMATGVLKLAQNKTLVKNLYSVESLARIDTLCLDKTGTITDGTMVVDNTIIFDPTTEINLVMSSYLAAVEDKNNTAMALLEKYGNNVYFKPLQILPFSSDRKFSAVEFRDNYGGFALGAPEYLSDDEEILEMTSRYTKKGMRVLLLVKFNKFKTPEELPKKKIPIAMFIIRDNIRKEVKETMQWFLENDVDIRVISGDNIDTVAYIANEAGIPNSDLAVDLSKINDKDLEEVVLKNYIFARVTPERKAKIVDILHAHGKVVAITGDGVNDVLAMKKSDCSVAMDNGSAATKSVADVVLMDSNFSNMPKTVMEGRRVVNNIQRASTLFLMKNFFFMFLSLASILLGLAFPIETSVMGIVNVLISGISSLLLSVENTSSRINGNFTKNVLGKAIPAGFFMFMPVLFIMIYGFITCGVTNIDSVNLFIASKVPVISMCIVVAGFIIFARVCQPFNKFRIILISVMTAIAILSLFAFPEMFLQNSTLFWGDLISKYSHLGGSDLFWSVANDVLNKIFSLNIYRQFSEMDWTLIVGFLLLSSLLYYIADKIISKVLKIKMFSVILDEDE